MHIRENSLSTFRPFCYSLLDSMIISLVGGVPGINPIFGPRPFCRPQFYPRGMQGQIIGDPNRVSRTRKTGMNGGIYSREKMRNLKTYRMFESSVELAPEQIEWLDKCTKGTWHLNPRTGLVDVRGGFDCEDQGLSDFRGVRFGVVDGYFDCRDNQLTSLEGAPQKVEDFYCADNQLTSLEGSPQKVGGEFDCHNNQLTSLRGAPREVGEDFDCTNNQLTTLEGAPQKVRGDFSCEDNQLTSLEGSPQEVRGDFWCHSNQLTSLEGAPQKAGQSFYCWGNQVSEGTLQRIFGIMKTGKGYLESVESLWTEIPVEDQILLYRPEFDWVVGGERKKLDALRAYQGFKGML